MIPMIPIIPIAPATRRVSRQCRDTKKSPGGIRFWMPPGPLKVAVTYSPTFAVPSARRGLTSLFGMGRGGSPALSPPLWRVRDAPCGAVLRPPSRRGLSVWLGKELLAPAGSVSRRHSRKRAAFAASLVQPRPPCLARAAAAGLVPAPCRGGRPGAGAAFPPAAAAALVFFMG